MRFTISLIFIVLANAQEDHSQHRHGVAGLGTVEFPTSCTGEANALMMRGAALLHSFGYAEARMTFQSAAQADPSCAMAHWGIARTWYHPIWAPPTPEEFKQGAAAIALAGKAKTNREQGYIDALRVFYQDSQSLDYSARATNYERALGQLSSRFPDDDEAAIFHALQLVAIGYLDPTDKTYLWQKKGGEILNRLLPRHGMHPGVAHYIIHSVDYPTLAELGLKAARAYAKIAPDAPHALHMPSHIFTRLGYWDDSIASNSAATKSAMAQAKRLNGGGGSFDQLHSMDYMLYAYLQRGQEKNARQTVSEMEQMVKLDENQFAAAYAFAAMPARWALERHDWKAAAALEVKPVWFPWNRFRNAEALIHYAKAIGAARSGDLVTARRATNEIAAIRDGLTATRDYDWSGSIGAQWEAATALRLWAEGQKDEGLRLLRAAADHEDSVDKHPVTPGSLLPVREILADLLLEKGEAREALQAYEAVLKMAPRRLNSVKGAAKAAEKLGEKNTAQNYATLSRELVKPNSRAKD